MRFSSTCQTKTPQAINKKFCTIDNVSQLTGCTKNGWNQLDGGGLAYRWNLTSKTLLRCTLRYVTLPSFLVCLYRPNGLTALHTRLLKRPELLEGSAFRGSSIHEITFRVKTPKNLKFWSPNAEFAVKSIHSNNFWTVRDRQNISTDHLYKIGVGESNSGVFSPVGRRQLAAKTISGSILKLWKSRITAGRKVIKR
jgi:hypothetical protein